MNKIFEPILFDYNIDVKILQQKQQNDNIGTQSPGQLTKHYAPDLPANILSHNTNSLNSLNSNNINLNECLIIDFGGQIETSLNIKNQCLVYWDLSKNSNAAEACNKLFTTLRLAESEKIKSQGVKRILLPDLRNIDDNENGLLMALWERIHRAASGNILE